jgi:hypothetical protein
MNYRLITTCALALTLGMATPAKAEIISFANPFAGLFSRSAKVETPSAKNEVTGSESESDNESEIAVKIDVSALNRSALEKMITDKENHAAQILYRLQDRNDDYAKVVSDLNNLTLEQEATGKDLSALRAALDRTSDKIQEANDLISEATGATQEYSGIPTATTISTEGPVSIKSASLSKANSKKVQLARLKAALKAAESAVQDARKAVYDLKKFKGDLQNN